MTETPKCIHNGAPCCRCMPNGPCAAPGPTKKTSVEAFSSALHRAEPENRLLTVNEATGSEDPVWLETRKTLMITDVCIATDYHYAEVYTIGRGIPYLILLDSYGKLWRCWLRKPTAEEMEREKWEE